MTKLFLSLIADTQLKRHIYMLKYLANTSDFVTIESIANKLEVSRKTIVSDLENLFLKLPAGITLTRKRGFGVKLVWEEQLSIENYIISLAQDTIEFKILDEVYRGDKHSILELEYKMFSSNFVIRQSIKHMNTILKGYKCSLSTTVVDMVGSEVNIRYFYYIFYRGMRDLFIIRPLENEFSEAFTELIQSISELGLPLLHLDFRQCLHWLEIAKTRLIKENFVKLDPNLMNNIKSRPTYQSFKSVFERIFASKLEISHIPEDEFIWTFVGCLCCIIYNTNYATQDKAYALIYSEEGETASSKKIDAFLEIHLPEFKMDNTRQSEAFKVHQAFLVNLNLLTQLSALFQKKTSLLKSYIIENHECTYNKWLTILKKTKHKQLFTIQYLEDVCVTLTLLTVSVLFNHITKRACHVLFSFHGEPGYPNYLSTMAKSILPDHVQCTYIFNQRIDDELIGKIDADIFVSNYDYQTEISNCSLVQFSYIPTIREWTLLKNLVVELTDE